MVKNVSPSIFIQKAKVSLLSPQERVKRLIDTTNRQIEAIEPEQIERANSNLNLSSITITEEIQLKTHCINSFFAYSCQTIKDEIRKVVGHSPGLLDDIKDWVKDKIKEYINKAIELGGKVYNFVKDGITKIIDLSVTTLINVYREAKTDLEMSINQAMRAIETRFKSVTSVASSIFGDIYDTLSSVGQAILLGFTTMITQMKELLNVEPEDLVKIHFKLQEAFLNAQKDFIIRSIKGD